jgi:RNA polymerase sigma-70 factor (ECF subfamily)
LSPESLGNRTDGRPRSSSLTFDHEDGPLIARLLQSNGHAQSAFIQRYDRLIRAVISRTLQGADWQECEDLRQHVYVLLWDKDCYRIRRWRGIRGTPFGAYLRSIVQHGVLDYLRCRARNRGITLDCPVGNAEEYWLGAAGCGPDTDVDPAIILEQRERLVALYDALDGLSERDRALILQKHLHGCTYEEMAATLGMTVNHVGVALARAETRLRIQLCHQYPDIFASLGNAAEKTVKVRGSKCRVGKGLMEMSGA